MGVEEVKPWGENSGVTKRYGSVERNNSFSPGDSLKSEKEGMWG